MAEFQRARTGEQRALRERDILATARAMLEEMPVARITLNELSRRTGLAKSNVLRYFESREDILLELLSDESQRFVDEFPSAETTDPGLPLADRATLLSAAIARNFAARPILCDLLSAQSSVLEHNVSVAVALRFKRGARDGLLGLSRIMRNMIPELSDQAALRVVGLIILLVGAIWVNAHPADATSSAFREDPSLRSMELDFEPALADAVRTYLTGVLCPL